ncbi:Transposable element P transposase [Aphis craccivora]|uniref:Transposable element P transposase n=1 Tax=Aphis craccivora TaxID=307492 RepID=A0A6G0W297_APHCR|nr:Transposable element P transposase [Aphis craccivora]
MTKAAAIFTRLQLRETNTTAKGRRFTLEEKLLSLSLYKRRTKSYNTLSKLFTLPCQKTLSNLLSKIPTEIGIDNTLIKILKKNFQNLSYRQKYYVIVFDDVSLEGFCHARGWGWQSLSPDTMTCRRVVLPVTEVRTGDDVHRN